MRNARSRLAGVVGPVSVLAALAAPGPLVVQDTQVTITVVVVDDLVPKPVPLTGFLIVRADGSGDPVTVRTDAQGNVTIKLAPGSYRLRSEKPVSYRGRTLSWDTPFVVEAGPAKTVTFTDADATVQQGGGGRQIGDEAKLFERVKSGVVTVEAGRGYGSGFLVDACGLIITNHHVTRSANFAAIRLSPGRRYSAVILEEDETADVAVIRANPEILKGCAVLPLAGADQGPVAEVGERVIAVGSPLGQEGIMTTGVVSKITADAIISDVNINPGNSGGPLLNMAGQVIGINTFGRQDKSGPGLAGVVAVSKALPVLQRARAKLGSAQLPSAEPLPDVSQTPIPVDALRAAAMTKMKAPPLIRAPRNFETIVYTPFYLASLDGKYEREVAKEMERRAAKRQSKGEEKGFRYAPRAFWRKYGGEEDPVVWVRVRPSLKEKWLSGFARIVTRGLTKAQGEFRDDFFDMVIERGGAEVQAVRRFRVRSDESFDRPAAAAKDAAYGGLYAFDPRAFEPGAPLVLKVRKATDLSKWHEVKIGKREQERIWAEFAPWRAALEAQGG